MDPTVFEYSVMAVLIRKVQITIQNLEFRMKPNGLKFIFFSAISWLGMPQFYLLSIIFFSINDFHVALKLIIAIAAVELFGGFIKIIYPKARPIPITYKTFRQKWDAGSFPSIHSARIVAVSAAFMKVYMSAPVIIISIIMVLLVGYSRVYLKKHYLSDVIAGFAMGTLISVMFFLA